MARVFAEYGLVAVAHLGVVGLAFGNTQTRVWRGRQDVIMVVGDSGSLLPEGETEYSLLIGIVVLNSTRLL